MFTISSSFVLKKPVNEYLNQYLSNNISDFISSFTLPVTAQFFSTPIHIYSIDLIQRPHQTIQQRLIHIKKIYWNVCMGRIIRVIPAFGLGGFINDMIRNR